MAADSSSKDGVAPPGPPPGPPPAAVKENPYLAHLPPSERFTSGDGVSSSSSGSDALSGFLPRNVTAAQVMKALEAPVNPFTSMPKPYSQKYKDILAKRKGLPVFAQVEDFLKKFQENQVLVMIGETGSGKTTQ